MAKETILVTGGAGYIGSHVNKMLQAQGYNTIVFDNLSTGSRQTILEGLFFEGDIGNIDSLESVFSHYSIDAVMDFAACIDVGESVRNPLKYYQNNVSNTLTLLSVMLKFRINRLIFSSSAAIFGHSIEERISENHPCLPINPYGTSKWMIEKILNDFDVAYGLKSCCLRYFNAAGGDPEGKIKSFQKNATNLIPLVLKSIKNKTSLTIFGTDYPTRDGTCIRDYIHLEDIGEAHILALKKLLESESSHQYNLGNGQGYSVKEVIQTAEKVTGEKVNVLEGQRRSGDPATLLADSRKAEKELGWNPRYPDLGTMIEHAWKALNH